MVGGMKMWILDLNRWTSREEEIFFKEFEKFYERQAKFSEIVSILEEQLHRSPGEIMWYYISMLRRMRDEFDELAEKKDFIDKVNSIDKNKIADYIDESVNEFLYY